MKTIKTSFEPPAEHGLVNALGSGRRPKEKHTDEICDGLVGVHVGFRPKAPNLCCSPETLIFLLHNKEVPVTHQEQVNYFWRNMQAMERVPQGSNWSGGNQRHKSEENCVRPNSDLSGKKNALLTCRQRTEKEIGFSLNGEGEQKPEQSDQAIDKYHSFGGIFDLKPGRAHQKDGKKKGCKQSEKLI